MHVDEQDEEVLAAQQRMRQIPRCVGGSWLFYVLLPWWLPVFIGNTRLGLQHLRHGLEAKLNGKRRSQTSEALDQISTDYSDARHAHAPIASPPLATPRSSKARQASMRMCYSLSPLLHTLASA
jgi:hypothetical protein